ncbi:replication protein, partial [Enterobacter hormaechei]|uniref:replication protein n=1 Tax=Enterobacter hormaechei TaxID=158836 RepID=UPI0023E3E0E5
WPLQTGQLVTTSADLGLNLCDREGKPCSRHAVDRMLDVFEREGMISRSGEKRKGSVITITNYAEYAQKMDDLPAHNAAHNSEHFPAHNESSNGAASEGSAAHNPEHKGALKPAHHEQEVILNTNVFNDRQKKTKSLPDAAVQTPAGDKWGTAEDLQCAEWMLALRNITKPSMKKPNLTSWANDIRMMRQLDGRTHREICQLFKWAAQDSFWHKNILSPAKLRKQWDTLALHREDVSRKPANDAPASDAHWNSPEAWENFI